MTITATAQGTRQLLGTEAHTEVQMRIESVLWLCVAAVALVFAIRYGLDAARR